MTAASYAWMLPGLLATGGLAARWTAIECRARRLGAEVSLLRRTARDAVVDLPTRAEWEAIACTRLSAAAEHTALVLIDLDEFKMINDAHGHLAGDHALRIVATRLTSAFEGFRAEIARLGGDEFGIVADADTVTEGLQRYNAAMRERCSLNGHAVHLRSSAGIAWCASLSTQSLEHGLAVADRELYRTKTAAKATRPITTPGT